MHSSGEAYFLAEADGGQRVSINSSINIDNRLNPTIEPDIAPAFGVPRLGAAITPFNWLELYTNYGQGFRSPDAVTELVPNFYPQAVQPFKIESEEVGGKIQTGRFSVQAAFYNTDAENEAFQPAPGFL